MNKMVLEIKQNIVSCLMIISLLVLSCNRADIEEENICRSGFLVTLSEDVRVESRSTPAELEDPLNTDFDLKIIRSSTGETVYSGKYTADLIQAPSGFYQINASFGDNPVLGVNTPYYEGYLSEVEVKKDTPSEVSLSCKVANALLSVVYDESIVNVYQSYYVTVSVGEQSCEIRDNESAYFRAGSVVSVVFHGVLKGESEEHMFELQHEELLAPLGAAEHAVLKLSIESGAIVSVEKLDIETATVSETIPLEYLPKPKLESTDFVDNELSFAETETKSAIINLKLSSPLQDLKLKFNSSDAKFAGLVADKEYVLSNADDKVAVETALGITLPKIGESEGSLDFSSLIPQLMTDAGNTVSSTIEVDVKANNRWSSKDEAANRVYTLKCNKPIFRVNVYPGNIWTREFTMNSLTAEDVEAGNYDLLRQKMKYQFSVDGQSNWIDLGEDLRKADLTPGTTYYIRGVYRDVIDSNPVAVTTYPQTELTNGGLEGATISKGADKNSSQYGAVYNWSGWSTLNELTCDKCSIIFGTWGNTAFNSRSGTRPSASIPNGSKGLSSAWIMTMGYGYGGWSSPQIITPSELFLGSLINVNHDNNTATKNYGIDYRSRPTGLRFFYKYAPYNNDSSDIYIQVKGSEGEILGEAKLNQNQAVTSFTEITLDINYDSQYAQLEPATLVVVFKSGFNLDVKDYGTGSKTGDNSAEPSHRGSELYIDDISLVYDK